MLYAVLVTIAARTLKPSACSSGVVSAMMACSAAASPLALSAPASPGRSSLHSGGMEQ